MNPPPSSRRALRAAAPHRSRSLSRPLLVGMIVLGALAVVLVAAEYAPAAAQVVDDGGSNPVVGAPGSAEQPSAGSNYGPWALVALCLIAAGLLLVKIERWEARRLPDPDNTNR